MRIFIAAISFVLLSGCTVIQPFIDKFTIAQFDENEYALVNKIRTVAALAGQRCDDQLTSKLYAKSLYHYGIELKNYSQYIPKNEQTKKPVELLYKMTVDVNDRYNKQETVSKTYCELKYKSIQQSAEMIQKAIGNRPRPSVW